MTKTARWRRSRAILLAAAAITVATPAVLQPTAAVATKTAPETHTVRVGAVHPERETLLFTAFYPNKLQVHAGDTVQWKFLDSYAGWHSVTFVPSDMDVAKHPVAQYPPEVGEEWGIEESGQVKIPDAVSLGSPDGFYGEACGRGALESIRVPAQQPCVIDSTDEAVGSSLSDTFVAMRDENDKTFTATFDETLATGSYRYHCVLHPDMVGEVEVVPDDEELDPYTEEEFVGDVAADVEDAQELAAQFENPATAYDQQTGEWTVHVTATTDDGRVTIMENLPADLTVKAGDSVRFVAGTGPGVGEPNTVTFPADTAGALCFEGGPNSCKGLGPAPGLRPLAAAAFVVGCDPDDLNSGLPMVPLSWLALRDCPEGQMREWTMPDFMSYGNRAPGDEVLTPVTFHNSGMMIPVGVPEVFRNRGDGTQFPSTFDAKFPVAGTFAYKCLVHPDYMGGLIRVVA